MNASSCFSTVSPAFVVISGPDFDHFNRCMVVSQCCFNLYFLDDVQTWSIFSYAYLLSAICISSSVRHLLRSLAHLLTGWQKPSQYCKVIILQLRQINFLKGMVKIDIFILYLILVGKLSFSLLTVI